jgi:hypothetical protein
MKGVYHGSIFSRWVDPHLFFDFASFYFGGMEQEEIEEAVNLCIPAILLTHLTLLILLTLPKPLCCRPC